MKKLVKVKKVEVRGLIGLLGENVMLFCMNYIYAGKLAGADQDDVLLENAMLVYETGELKAKTFKDAQPMPASLYIRISAIESYGLSGR